MKETNQTDMVFRQFGRSMHLEIMGAQGLKRALELDEAHWVAINVPIAAFHADPTLLQLMDIDGDDRIKVGEFKQAIRWLFARLTDTSGIDQASTVLQPDGLRAGDPEADSIRTALGKIAAQKGQPVDTPIPLETIREVKQRIEQQPVSEAGVVLPTATDDPELAEFISDAIATTGGTEHPSGALGINEAQVDVFVDVARRYMDWRQEGRCPAGATTEIMPLGEAKTGSAYQHYAALRDKIDEFFAMCEALVLDPGLKASFWPRDATLQVEGLDAVDGIQAMLAESPVNEPTPDRCLNLNEPRNPHYAESLARVSAEVVQPLTGSASTGLTESEWNEVKRRFSRYEAWLAARPSETMERLQDKLETIIGGSHADAVRQLVRRSAESAFALENLRNAEKLSLFQGHLVELANNFVSFPYLYDPAKDALFEEGCLIMDGRRFSLAVTVPDRNEHLKAANAGSMFVLYVEISNQLKNKTAEVAVPVTSGTQGNLDVGKRGVFKHVDGTEWRARVVHVVDHPISLREAMWSPFKRLGESVTGKIESITASAEKELQKAGADAVGQVQAAPQTASAAPPASATGGGMGVGGVLAGGGIAVAALGSSLTFIVKTIANLNPLQLVGGIAATILAVLIPTAIVAALRLQRRDLSCILEGSGWGINARMRLTRKQRRYFTQRPDYPEGSQFRREPRWGLIWSLVLVGVLIAGSLWWQRSHSERKVERPSASVPEAVSTES